MESLNEKQLKRLDFDNVLMFTFEHVKFRKDTKLRSILNKMFGADIKHVFSDLKNDDKASDHIDLGCTEIIFVNNKGKVHHMTNSEWGGIWRL